MATNFPTSLDVYADKVDNVSTVLATSINNLQDAAAQLQAKVGINDSLATPSYDYVVGDFFSTSVPRQMFFWMSTPPVGWSTSGVATNCVVGIKGGSGTWNDTGAQKLGSWVINDQVADAHSQQWLASYGSDPWAYSYQSDGSTANNPVVSGVLASFDTCKGLVAQYYYLGSKSDRNYTEAGNCYTSVDSHSHTFGSAWRPLSAVGILAKYTGT
jgi:hypothetical protein